MSAETDAIVTLAHGGSGIQNKIDYETEQRVNTSVSLFEQGVSEHVVMSGFKSFLDQTSKGSAALLMKEYAITNGVPADSIFTEGKSLDTIGNAYFTKKEILEPNAWKSISVITSPYHLERSRRVFEQVLGGSYDILMVPAPEASNQPQRVYEFLGTALEQQVLGGLEQGDDAAVYERLKKLVPGYVNPVSIPTLFGNHLRRLVSK